MFRSTLRAIIRRTAVEFEDLAASSLLEEALEVLIVVAAPHWNGSTIADVPEMIQELARDRDEYKRMAESYRAQLAETEAELSDALERLAVRDLYE